jgi:hypothetical protein
MADLLAAADEERRRIKGKGLAMHGEQKERTPPSGSPRSRPSYADTTRSGRPPLVHLPANLAPHLRPTAIPGPGSPEGSFSSLPGTPVGTRLDPYQVAFPMEFPPISEQVLHKVIDQLPPPPATIPDGQCVKTFQLDTEALGLRSAELQSVGLILFTPGITLQDVTMCMTGLTLPLLEILGSSSSKSAYWHPVRFLFSLIALCRVSVC